jgi:acyl dehydratase
MSEFTRPVNERFFEDYVPGVDVTYGAAAVREDDILRFATEFDPQTIHINIAEAADGPFRGLIASGWHTASIVMRIVATEFLNEKASLASPGVDELRWVRPVRPGDVLSARFEVVEARASQSKPDRGIVHTRITALNQEHEPVLTMVAINLIRRRS